MEGGLTGYRAVLRTKSEEGTERIITKGRSPEDGVFLFEKEGVTFRIHVQKDAITVGRGGEMAYELELKRDAETEVTIVTSFGEVKATARVKEMQVRESDGQTEAECEYTLDFSGYTQNHAIHFSAKRNER